MATPLGNALDFFEKFGFYDVVLPFLLIFTIVFAILEKTRVLGITDKGKPKANINSMVAFVIAMFFVALTPVVTALKLSTPYVAFLLVVLITYMMLVGSYASGKEEFTFQNLGFWRVLMGIIIFVAVVAIFLNAFGWLDRVVDYVVDNWQGTFLVSIVFVGFIIGAIYWLAFSKDSEKSG